VTDQPQSGPPAGADAGSDPEPTGDMPAALEPDAPTKVHGTETETQPAAAAETETEVAPPSPPPPTPPPVIAAPMADQGTATPAAVPPPEPGDSVAPPPAPSVPPAQSPRPEDDVSSGGPAALAAERPEIAIGAAFAGGLALALILKRLAR
jgi:hypothetical protein